MGLDSIWDNEGNYLTKKSKGFSARSTGCSCCSSTLDTKEEVRKEMLDSLKYVVRGCNYFRWKVDDLVKEANKINNKELGGE